MSWRQATDFERDLLARAREDWAAWPAMFDLVQVLTLVPRIEPRLLRNARLRFTPGLATEAEARLWFSPLVESRDTLAIVLHRGVARLLAEPLVAGHEQVPAIDVVWDFTREHTRHWPAEDRLERDLRYAALVDDRHGLEQGFRDILRLIHATTRRPAAERDRERVRLSRLAKRALPAVAQPETLPDEGRLMAQYAALALGDAANWAVSAQTTLPEWIGQRLPAPVGAARLAVNLREDAELGRVLHFLEPATDAAADTEALSFPTPLPARLHVAAAGEPGDWYTVAVDSRVRVPDVAVLVLTTLEGRRWTLRSQARAPDAQTGQASLADSLLLTFVEADSETAASIKRWLEGQGLQVELLQDGAQAPPPGARATARVVRLWTAAAQREWVNRDLADREALTNSLLLQLEDIDSAAEGEAPEVQRLDWRDWQHALDGDRGAPLLEDLRRWLAMPAEAPPETRSAVDAADEDAVTIKGHLFLSYAREDRDRIQAVAAALAKDGWRVWWDRENLPPGRRFDQIIDEAIQGSACVLVFWSQHSVDSDWVIDEATEGKHLNKLLPVVLDESRPPYGFRTYHYLDLSAWDGAPTHDSYRRLVKAIADYAPQPVTKVAGLLAEIVDPDTEPKRRLAIGDRLAQLGDPRPGVGLDTAGLPNIDWVEVPAGPFLYGVAKEKRELATFYIARYPTTNAQYQAFIDAGGYGEDRWWQGPAKRFDSPADGRWGESNRPRETVSWYEAMAFCRWLSGRLGYEVRLPSEYEWEKAARGTDGREYPWGDDSRPSYANVDETITEVGPTNLAQTTAVGLYPQGASSYGVEDLAGNVWEWCLNEYEELEKIDPGGSTSRALRGGSWFGNPVYARASYRLGFDPDSRRGDIGFRVVCSSPITH